MLTVNPSDFNPPVPRLSHSNQMMPWWLCAHGRVKASAWAFPVLWCADPREVWLDPRYAGSSCASPLMQMIHWCPDWIYLSLAMHHFISHFYHFWHAFLFISQDDCDDFWCITKMNNWHESKGKPLSPATRTHTHTHRTATVDTQHDLAQSKFVSLQLRTCMWSLQRRMLPAQSRSALVEVHRIYAFTICSWNLFDQTS